MSDLLTRLRRRLAPPDGGDRPDSQLLTQFLGRDEAAFAALVHRHGPLVLGVCRRVLHDPHDADDAFQAAFLVLARRAAALVGPRPLGPWLYGVALRTARALRQQRRRRREEPLTADPHAPLVEPFDADLREQLDAAVRGLPEKYRTAVVLCYLQGLTRREAAARLGCPEGTVGARLTRACQRLRRKLAAREFVAGSLVATLAQAGAAAVPAELAGATARAAAVVLTESLAAAATPAVAELTRGVLRMLWLRRLTATAGVLAAVLAVGSGMGFLLLPTRPAAADEPQAAANNPAPPALLVTLKDDAGGWPIQLTEAGHEVAFKKAEALQLYLTRLLREPGAPNTITIAAKGVRYGDFVAVLDACKGAGITRVHIPNRGPGGDLFLGEPARGAPPPLTARSRQAPPLTAPARLGSPGGQAGAGGDAAEMMRQMMGQRRNGTTGSGTAPPETAGQVAARLQGTWRVFRVLTDGQTVTQDDLDRSFITRVTFKDDVMTHHFDGLKEGRPQQYRIDPAHTPGWLDWRIQPGSPGADRLPSDWTLGVYRLDGDRLDLSFFQDPRDARRPSDLSTVPARGSSRVVLNLTREPAKAANQEAPFGRVSIFDPTLNLVVLKLDDPQRVRVGDKLDLYRLDPQPEKSRYLGTVEIVEVRGDEAAGRVKALGGQHQPQQGDLVGRLGLGR